MWQNTDSVFNIWQNTDSLFKLYFMASLMNGQHVNLSSNMLTWAPSQCVKHESMILDVSDPDPWLFRTRQMVQTHHPGCIPSRSNHDPLWSSSLGPPGWLMATKGLLGQFWTVFGHKMGPVNKSKKTRRVVCSNITKKSKENNRNSLGTPIESALKLRGTGWN